MMDFYWMVLFITPIGVFTQDWANSSEPDLPVLSSFYLNSHVGKRSFSFGNNESGLSVHWFFFFKWIEKIPNMNSNIDIIWFLSVLAFPSLCTSNYGLGALSFMRGMISLLEHTNVHMAQHLLITPLSSPRVCFINDLLCRMNKGLPEKVTQVFISWFFFPLSYFVFVLSACLVCQWDEKIV